MSRDQIATRVAEGRAEFRADLEALLEIVNSLDAELVVISQAISLNGWDDSFDGWDSYASELARVDAELEEEGGVLAPRVAILLHEAFTEEIEAFARVHDLAQVDGLGLLERDDRSEFMISFVHLTPAGNQILSKGIVDALVEHGSLQP